MKPIVCKAPAADGRAHRLALGLRVVLGHDDDDLDAGEAELEENPRRYVELRLAVITSTNRFELHFYDAPRGSPDPLADALARLGADPFAHVLEERESIRLARLRWEGVEVPQNAELVPTFTGSSKGVTVPTLWTRPELVARVVLGDCLEAALRLASWEIVDIRTGLRR
jgi:hypothetical protein